jgi:protein-tyrosine phosphatase
MTIVTLPGGRQVRGRGLRNPTPDGPDPAYGLYLGHRPDVPWPHENLDWPDFRLPRDEARAVELIKDLYARADGRLVEVACGGGIGRTGTVMACLAVLSGVAADDAVAWTREHYHRRAVETPWQKRWVRQFPA